MQDMFDAGAKVVLVTAGSRGLGKAMSLEFAARGACVVVASRKREECEKVVSQIRDAGGKGIAVECRVGDWRGLEGIVEQVTEQCGRIDVLVKNAGMSPVAPSLLKTSEALFDKIIDVNLKGPTRLTAYSAAKVGLNALTVATAQEHAPLGVRP